MEQKEGKTMNTQKYNSMRRSVNFISEEALPLITGIENIEMFLEEDDQWCFHDSDIREVVWNNRERTLDLVVEPIGFSPDLGWNRKTYTALLDFHFSSVDTYDLDCTGYCYIFELEISSKCGFLDCIFDSYTLRVVAKHLTVDAPRIIEITAE